MKYLFKTVRFALTMALIIAMFFAMSMNVYAEADAAFPDFDQTGSVSLTLADDSGIPVTDGAVALCQVATLYMEDGNLAYAYTESFADCGEILDVADTSLAASLAEYASDHNITGTTVCIGSDGTVRFDGLTLGLYLVVQTVQSTGYNIISPFLVTVPIEENNVWVYAVDASPKVEVYTDDTVPSEPKTPPAVTTKTTAATTLPQTGQLNWPVPVLAASGVVLFAVGWTMAGGERKKRGHAA